MAQESPYVRHWRQFCPVPGLVLRRAQVMALDVRDLAELRFTFGLTLEMLDTLITLATDDNETRDVRFDFEAGTVTPID